MDDDGRPRHAPAETPRQHVEPPSARDHLANERTLLAWVRTALTIVGLGFIVDRLALQDSPVGGLEALAGVALVIVGGLIAVGGAWSFLRARRELSGGTYQPTIALNLGLVAVVTLGSLVLAAALLLSRSP